MSEDSFVCGYSAGHELGWNRGFEKGFEAGRDREKNPDLPPKEVEEERRKLFLNAYKSMPYADYLASVHWQEVRQRYKTKIGGILFCQFDRNHSGPFDIHHNTYERRGEEHPDDLLCLCRSCHEKHHGRQP